MFLGLVNIVLSTLWIFKIRLIRSSWSRLKLTEIGQRLALLYWRVVKPKMVCICAVEHCHFCKMLKHALNPAAPSVFCVVDIQAPLSGFNLSTQKALLTGQKMNLVIALLAIRSIEDCSGQPS